MKTFLLLAALCGVSIASAAVSWTTSPPSLVGAGQSYSMGAKNTVMASNAAVNIFKNGSLVSQGGTGGPGNTTITATTSYTSGGGSAGQTISYYAEGWSNVNGPYGLDSTTGTTTTNVNSAPSAWISGSTTLNVGQTGSWTFGVSDPQANLSQWRFYNSTNPNPQWSNISGGSQSGSYSTSFATAGTQTWRVDVTDSYGLSGSASINVTVSAATFTLSTGSSPSNGGSVSGAGTYTSGGTATVTATPSAGYSFVNWSGDLTGTGNPKSLTMNANKSVTANFAQVPQHTLTVSVSPGGAGATTGAGTYASSTTATVTASANTGYTFSHWSGAASGTSTSTTVLMNADKSATANFTVINRTLSTSVSPAGAGSVSGGGSHPHGTNAPIAATANTGYTFSHWSGDASGSTNPTTVSMTSNKSVTANFTVINRTLSTSVSPSGAGSVSGGGSHPHGTNATITATANTGYTFSHWSGSASGSTNPTTVSMTSDKSVTANFSVVPLVPAITSALTASTPISTSFSYQITASNTPTSYSASGLPAGLSVNTSTGSIAGTPTASGTFNVVLGATNASGTGSATLELLVTGGTAAPTALTASAITGIGFTANWTAVSGATGYRLDVSTGSTFTSYVTGYQNLSAGGTSAAVTGLTVNTTYHYRVRAVSAGGTSANSNVIAVLTGTSNPNGDDDSDGILNGVEQQLGTAGHTTTTDTNNQSTQLNVHRP